MNFPASQEQLDVRKYFLSKCTKRHSNALEKQTNAIACSVSLFKQGAYGLLITSAFSYLLLTFQSTSCLEISCMPKAFQVLLYKQRITVTP